MRGRRRARRARYRQRVALRLHRPRLQSISSVRPGCALLWALPEYWWVAAFGVWVACPRPSFGTGGAIHAGGGRPTDELAAFCGQLAVGWLILEPADPESEGLFERRHPFLCSNFESGRSVFSVFYFLAPLGQW